MSSLYASGARITLVMLEAKYANQLATNIVSIVPVLWITSRRNALVSLPMHVSRDFTIIGTHEVGSSVDDYIRLPANEKRPLRGMAVMIDRGLFAACEVVCSCGDDECLYVY